MYKVANDEKQESQSERNFHSRMTAYVALEGSQNLHNLSDHDVFSRRRSRPLDLCLRWFVPYSEGQTLANFISLDKKHAG